MAQDPGLGYVSTRQAFSPDLCIVGSKVLTPIFKRMLPKKRPMDNMRMALELPQEEEYATGNLSPYSFYIGYSLPRRMGALFDRLSCENGHRGDIDAWKGFYLTVLKKATFIMGGRRLVIKNPLNTARVPALLEMFPDARFVFCFRNPYAVYPSLVHTFTRMIGSFQLERVSKAAIEEYALSFFERMMSAFWAARESIPAENLVELRYEDLEKDPMAALQAIYRQFGLPGFERARPLFVDYAASLEGYEKNHYEVNSDEIERVGNRWGFAIERLGYSLPDELMGASPGSTF